MSANATLSYGTRLYGLDENGVRQYLGQAPVGFAGEWNTDEWHMGETLWDKLDAWVKEVGYSDRVRVESFGDEHWNGLGSVAFAKGSDFTAQELPLIVADFATVDVEQWDKDIRDFCEAVGQEEPQIGWLLSAWSDE